MTDFEHEAMDASKDKSNYRHDPVLVINDAFIDGARWAQHRSAAKTILKMSRMIEQISIAQVALLTLAKESEVAREALHKMDQA